MRLVKILIRLADGSKTVRWAHTAQDVEAVTADYLRIIPGAVTALRVPSVRIDQGRAVQIEWLQQTHQSLARADRILNP